MSVFAGVHMPSLDGATGWVNSDPLGPAELRGHVVLVDFWTFTCINWLRQEPYVRAWWRAYRDDGLVVIGAHTPEFSFEHDVELIRQAIQARGIDYPVAVDNDYGVWDAFANRYWPANGPAGRSASCSSAPAGASPCATRRATPTPCCPAAGRGRSRSA